MTTTNQVQKPEEPDFGWYGAGYACFKSDRLIPGFFSAMDGDLGIVRY